MRRCTVRINIPQEVNEKLFDMVAWNTEVDQEELPDEEEKIYFTENGDFGPEFVNSLEKVPDNNYTGYSTVAIKVPQPEPQPQQNLCTDLIPLTQNDKEYTIQEYNNSLQPPGTYTGFTRLYVNIPTNPNQVNAYQGLLLPEAMAQGSSGLNRMYQVSVNNMNEILEELNRPHNYDYFGTIEFHMASVAYTSGNTNAPYINATWNMNTFIQDGTEITQKYMILSLADEQKYQDPFQCGFADKCKITTAKYGAPLVSSDKRTRSVTSSSSNQTYSHQTKKLTQDINMMLYHVSSGSSSTQNNAKRTRDGQVVNYTTTTYETTDFNVYDEVDMIVEISLLDNYVINLKGFSEQTYSVLTNYNVENNKDYIVPCE